MHGDHHDYQDDDVYLNNSAQSSTKSVCNCPCRLDAGVLVAQLQSFPLKACDKCGTAAGKIGFIQSCNKPNKDNVVLFKYASFVFHLAVPETKTKELSKASGWLEPSNLCSDHGWYAQEWIAHCLGFTKDSIKVCLV
mmetsp:Transcript_8867/g.11796  ORF Transcript_8867/g.11796 Transcript_8867/m.11796 type:complete len:137 (+) Transcript_8867:155-565(+)